MVAELPRGGVRARRPAHQQFGLREGQSKRGQDLVRNGDFSSARLLLKRAAEAGSAAAALSLGETFDPLVLQQFHGIGVQPDLAQARDWYERAARLGSDVAAQRLAKIAPPPQ